MMISCFRQIIALFALIGLLSGGGMAVYAQVPEGQSVRGPNDTATTEQLDNSSQEQISQNTDTAGAATNSADPLEGKSPSERAISDMYRRITLKNPELKLTDFASLLFTASQHSLIIEAKEGFMTRPPEGTVSKEPPPMGPREVVVGGIIYVSKGDWVVWLNGQKIGPDNLPPEILDIRVSKEFIKLKWYDAFTNQVFPIKLRAHQRFNIDTRIFLPG